ncbi:hypothetical protein [Paraburkholderia sp. BCC1886]|nr:hypothetical protein [Paraburkholderia sp. BCC1886]
MNSTRRTRRMAWPDWQIRIAATKARFVCAMMLCALAYVGSVPAME